MKKSVCGEVHTEENWSGAATDKKRIALLVVVVMMFSSGVSLADPPLVGVGLALRKDNPDGTLQISQVIPESSAAREGLTVGSIITKIDEVDPKGKKLEDCVAMLRGPSATVVRVEVTDPATKAPKTVLLTRQELSLNAAASPAAAAAAPAAPAAPEKADSSNVVPAHLQLAVYELRTTPEEAAKLDAKTLADAAATADSLLEKLAPAGKTRILYRIDQPVNLYSDRIQMGAREQVVTGTRLTATGQRINSVTYQNVGVVVQLSSTKAANEGAANVNLDVELATITTSDKETVPGAKGVTPRNMKLTHSEPLRFDRPALMLSVSSASEEDAASPLVYVIRYVFAAPPPK